MIRLTQSIMQFLSFPLICYAVGRADMKALDQGEDSNRRCSPQGCTNFNRSHADKTTAESTADKFAGKSNEEILRDLDARDPHSRDGARNNVDAKENDLAGVGTAGEDSDFGATYRSFNQNGSTVKEYDTDIPGEGASIMSGNDREAATEYGERVHDAQKLGDALTKKKEDLV
ncbi:MAG: hypothetical protein LUG50_06170 [Planctomycetaceae bacterium]|nr:hypothetical protein [Planctomycetaceae bacterium]